VFMCTANKNMSIIPQNCRLRKFDFGGKTVLKYIVKRLHFKILCVQAVFLMNGDSVVQMWLYFSSILLKGMTR
jgi:hypothetical protein